MDFIRLTNLGTSSAIGHSDRKRDVGPKRFHTTSDTIERTKIMLGWTLIFLILAIIAGILGFTTIAVGAAGIAKILFFVFLALLIISAIARAVGGGRP